MPVPTVAVPVCPICGHAGGDVLHADLPDRVYAATDVVTRLVRCPSCGAVRQDPRPADAAIGDLYGTYYTHEPPTTEPPAHGRAAVARRAVRDGLLAATLGYRLPGANERAGALAARVGPLAAWTRRVVRDLPAGGRLLDVGCGNGSFVAQAAAFGWDAAGIDPDPSGVQAARAAGLDVSTESLADRAAREPGAFDAVTLSHVIEHVPDPVAFLHDARRLLRPGGHLWLATPNLEADGHEAFGRDWLGLEPPRHLVLFDAGAMREALGRAGFAGVEVLPASFPSLLAFRVSQGARDGVVPAWDAPQPPPRVRLAAVRATVRALRDPRHAEELVVRAVAA